MRRPLIAIPAAVCVLLLIPTPAAAVEPGVDIAAPRVAIAGMSDAFVFSPANLRVEQGDYVRWRFTGVGSCHTTTSGAVCGQPSGLWNVIIGSPTCLGGPVQVFTRQFLEAPGTIGYFCSPHCSLGMRGQVSVTTPINLAVTVAGSDTTLSYSGGGGLYRIFRSDVPGFTGAGTTVLTPPGGTSVTTFTDTQSVPAEGRAFFYLVMNQF
jgi:plastocyanin